MRGTRHDHGCRPGYRGALTVQQTVVTLNKRTKLAYGLGQIAETVKSTGFDIFLFFYFTQVLGLSGLLAGLAVMIALVFDAVTDPLAGYISDRWRSPRGRRHPFMVVAALPLGVAWFVLFMPPAELSQAGLFLWLVTFAVAVRGMITLYYVPYLALGAELTRDYHERTSVAAWRAFCGVFGAALVVFIGVGVFFPETEAFENGLLNPAGYPRVALAGAIIMVVVILLSAWGTRSRIPHLPKAPDRVAGIDLRRDVLDAWSNASFRALFIGMALVAVSIGIVQTLNMHLNVFFWELGSNVIAFLAAAILMGWPVGILLAQPAHRRFDKKATIISAALVSAIAGNVAVISELLGIFPARDSGLFIPLLFSLLFVGGAASGLAVTSGASMMADVTQEHQYRTGRYQEGFLFSAVAFTGKMAAAAGYLVAGMGLDLIGFPLQAQPSEVDPEQVTQLALLNLSAAIFGFASILAYTGYRIDHARQAMTREALNRREDQA